MILLGTAPSSAGTINYTGGSGFSFPFNLSEDTTVEMDSGTATQSGALRENVLGIHVTKTGNGTLVLSAVNTYTGGTTVSAGILRAGIANTLWGSSALIVAPGAIFDLNSFNQTVGSLAGSGTVLTGTARLTAGGDNTDTAFSGTITHTNNGWDPSFGTFEKTGTGTLNLSGATITGGENYVTGGAIAFAGGTSAISYLAVGSGNGNTGAMDVSGGTLTISTYLQVGDFGGNGTVTQTGGTVRTEAGCGNGNHCIGFNIGNQGGNGIYTISGGALELNGGLNNLGHNSGGNPASSGTLNIEDGGLVVIRPAASDIGKFILGSREAASGGEGTGTINQTGGILRVESGSLFFLSAYGNGVYNLSGGMLQIGGANSLMERYAGSGSYAFNLGGGTIQVLGSDLVSAVDFGLVGGTVSTIDTNGLNATLSGTLSGTGGIAKTGAGTLALSGNNSYEGGTFLNAGILQVTADNNLGASTGGLTIDGGTLQFLAGFSAGRPIALNAGGGIFDTDGNNATLGGPISGAGGLSKIGTGTLTLTGADSYAGATTVNAGTLQAGAASVLSPSSAFAIASGGSLDLDNFSQTIGSLSGSGRVMLGSATLAGGNDGTSTEFSGVISGTGGLRKVGGGTLGLTGDSTYTGPTNIDAGVLNVTGSLASTVSVNSDGTLTGNGTIGGLAAASGGVVKPGNSTLNVVGNVGFAAGSVFGVDVNAAGQSSLIAAGGFATLAGGTVEVFGAPTPKLTYTILTAQQGVNGTFANVVTPSFVFLSPELSYTPTSVQFSLQQTRAFTSVAATPNQASVAAALGELPANNSLYQALLTQPSAAGARQAFDALSGEIHASTRSVMLDDSHFVRQAVLGRLRQATFGGATGPMAALGGGGPTLAYAEPAPSFADRFAPAESTFAYADTPRTAYPAKAPPLASREPETAWWTQGVGAWGKIGGDQNAASASHDLGGFFSGVDSRFGNHWRAGIAGGYTNSSVNVDSRASFGTIDTTHLAAYAGGNYGSWNLRSGAAMSWSRIDTSRTILFPGFVDSASARYDASTAQIFGEVGYGIALGTVAAEPFAGLAWVHLSTDGFSETGGSAALSGSRGADDVGYSTLGTRVAANYILPNGMVLIPRASVAWQHAVGDVAPAATLAFQGAGAAFTVAGVPLAPDAALVEVGFDLPITQQATFGISYVGQLADSAQNHSIRGNLLVQF